MREREHKYLLVKEKKEREISDMIHLTNKSARNTPHCSACESLLSGQMEILHPKAHRLCLSRVHVHWVLPGELQLFCYLELAGVFSSEV